MQRETQARKKKKTKRNPETVRDSKQRGRLRDRK